MSVLKSAFVSAFVLGLSAVRAITTMNAVNGETNILEEATMPAASNDLFLSLDGDGDGRLSLDEYMLDWDRVHDAMFEEEDTDSDGFVSRSEFRGVRGHRAKASGGVDRDDPLLDNSDDNVVPRTLAWLRDKGEWRYQNMRNVEAVTRTLELLFSDLDVDWTDKQLPAVIIGKVDLAISTASSALRTFVEMKPKNAGGRLLPPWVAGVASSPLSRRPATVKWVAEEVVHLPLLQYLIELYVVSRSAVVRSLILQFCDEVAWPGVPAQAVRKTSAATLGLVPSVMELMVGFSWADVTLINHLSRAGHPTPALLLPRKSWATHGRPRGESLVHSYMAAFASTGTLTPVGLSHLHALTMGTGRGADLTKLLFVVLDVMRKRNVDLFESMEMIGEHPGIRSEQGYRALVDVLFPNLLLASPTFKRLRGMWDADISSADYLSKTATHMIVEDCMIHTFRQLSSGGSNVSSVDIDVSSVPLDQLDAYQAFWRQGKVIPPRRQRLPAPVLDLREVCIRSFNTGRNPLHELAIVGHGRLASEILAQLLEKLRRQESSPGFVPTPPLNVSLLEYNVTSARLNALSRSRFSKGAEPQDDTTALGLAADRAAEQVFLRVASERSHQYRAALQAALLTPDQRLQRTPLHLAALLHGGGSLIFSTLCDAVVQSGLSLDAVLDLPDAAGKTPRQYATGAFEPFDDGDIREMAAQTYTAIAEADALEGTKQPSPLLARGQRFGNERRHTSHDEYGADESTDEWMSAGEDGGWLKQHRADLELQPRGLCQVTEFWGAPTAAQLAVVVNQGRPVVFRGALRQLEVNRSAWARASLLERFGNADATLRDIPYRMSQSSILDADTSDTVLPLREFASRFPYEAAAAAAATEQRQLRMDDAVASSEEIPLYLFSSEFAESNQDIYKDVLPLVRLVDKVPGVAGLKKGQFFLGPAGSGAPLHFHSLALNAVMYGRKRWALLAPKDALYSQKPALRFFEEDLTVLRAADEATDRAFRRQRDHGYQVHDVEGDWEVFEFTQHAGDLVFVPDFWSHATLNVETSIGIAFEMENFNTAAYAMGVDTIRSLYKDVPGTTFGAAFGAERLETEK